MAFSQRDRAIAGWVSGALLVILVIFALSQSDHERPPLEDDPVWVWASLLAGVFIFFLLGILGIRNGQIRSPLGRLEVRAAGALAACLFILLSRLDRATLDCTYGSPAQAERAGVRTTEEGATAGGAQTTGGQDTASVGPERNTAVLSLAQLSPATTKREILKALGKPERCDGGGSNRAETWYYDSLSQPYIDMKNAVIFDFFPSSDSLAAVYVVTPRGARHLRDVNLTDAFTQLVGSSLSELTSRFGPPDEQMALSEGRLSPQYFIESPKGKPARLRALCDAQGKCGAIGVIWRERQFTRPDSI